MLEVKISNTWLINPEIGFVDEISRQMAGMLLARILKRATPRRAAKSLTQEQVNQMIEECFA